MKEYMNEVSLSRVWKHIEDNRSFGIITAYRTDKTNKENKNNNFDLKHEIRKGGFGFFKLEGHYIEGYGSENAKDTKEESFFVIGNEGHDSNLLGLLKKLGKKYNQDSIFFKSGDQENAILIGTNSDAWPGLNKKVSVGKWHPSKSGEFYSEMKGRTFVFEKAYQQCQWNTAFARYLVESAS